MECLKRDLRRLRCAQKRLMEIAQAVNAGAHLRTVLRMVRDSLVQDAGFDRVGIWLYDEEAGGMRGTWGTGREGEPVDETNLFFPMEQESSHPLQRVMRGELRYYLSHAYEQDHKLAVGQDMSGVRHHASVGLITENRIVGMLFVDSLLSGRELTDQDMENVLPFCEQAAVAIESARLRQEEERKAVRLANAVRETNHRVKNSLQVVAALLDMHLIEGREGINRAELRRLVSQIRAIAAVHDFLSHESQDLSVNARAFLEKLVTTISIGPMPECTLECDEMILPVRQSTALALITNELVSNAGKHGATKVTVRLGTHRGKRYLEVEDNGPGFPPDFDPQAHAHLGLEMVLTLAHWDMQGTIAFSSRPEGGGLVRIVFPGR